MALLADTAGAVIGVDTHAGTHTACLADRLGRQLAVITIAADPGGCRRLLAWARRHAPGPRLAWSVEGTRSHGLGLTRYLHAHGQLVTEAGGQNAPAGGRALSLTRLMRPGPDRVRVGCRLVVIVSSAPGPGVVPLRPGAAGLYGCGGLRLWYGRGGISGGHRDRWRAWLPGRADKLHRPGRGGARGGGAAA